MTTKDKYLVPVRDEVCRIVKEYDLIWPDMKYYIYVHFTPVGDGTVYLSYENNSYTLISEERGKEYFRLTGFSFYEAVRYYIFGIAGSYASNYELNNRKGRNYSRWNWMKPCIDAMARISKDYQQYAYNDYKSVLKNTPLTQDEITNSWFEIPENILELTYKE